MKKQTIAFLILLTSVSLIGIILIQLYWVRNAMELQEEQFNNKVQVTLKSVVNRMFEEKGNLPPDPEICGEHCDRRTFQVLSAINPVRLDSLMQEEFGGMEITRKYVWAIFNPGCGTVFAGDAGDFKQQLMVTRHVVSLSCLYRSEQLMLGVYFPGEKGVLARRILPWLILSFFLLAVMISAFSYMIFSFLKQKKLSEMKTDFVNNMTHEFKTPISTISLASEMLLNPKVNESVERTQRYAGIIFDENLRLKHQVEQVLQIAVLDKGSFRLKKKYFDAHEAILNCLKSFELTVRDKGGFLSFKPEASESRIFADENHFINIVNNLLDNAAKYSRSYPEILVVTRNDNGMFVLEVHDKGIGISAENLKHIFKKLYRVPTGNVHDVKGFGLGLYYVKTMTEAHNGFVKVRSELKKGSIFDIHLPMENTTELTTEYHDTESQDIAG
ncbi:MAG: HAMP domain-containing histidine kinase [Lentimicrobiaceae bacterium]|nr:HAMP domain-containing histidine kinase [Lentimicrobiaceae bacterium]MCB9024419.1 HAMP domain-containing histidine kinase [Lentimicrobiaceae bacterium]MCO5265633.1 HAMP domain-containing histidine kinase [Lentimicrobium sp.]HPG33789.1 HAMP domain-containing sensor histidine kinase [Lentimicrobium sp.]